MDFGGQIAVVTGAASGIGAALCKELARRGAQVTAADLAPILVHGVTVAHADVTLAADVEELATATLQRHGRIDLWINNAGVAIGGATDELELDDWQRVIGVNLTGVIHAVHAVYPRMLRQGHGHIVNVASVAGLAPYPFALPYTTSKHAVVGLSQALRAEARSRGVRVSVACPGKIETPIWQNSDIRGALGRHRERLLSYTPPNMSAERCARAILRGVRANHGIIPITLEARAAWWLSRFSPALAANISSQLADFARRLSN